MGRNGAANGTPIETPRILLRRNVVVNFALLGWRPQLLGWRPSPLGWRPLLDPSCLSSLVSHSEHRFNQGRSPKFLAWMFQVFPSCFPDSLAPSSDARSP